MEKTLLDPTVKQNVKYCIPLWLRDEQINASIKRIKGRISGAEKLIDEPIAIVCFGPSLNETWEQIKQYKYIMCCSGAHKFLLDKNIIPNWHLEVDPRAHKVELIGQPNQAVEYIIASTCHAAVFDHLEGYNVKLWHVFDNTEDALRTLPHGEWAVTGGCSVGLRCLTMARFFGFTDLHIFGMDGSEGSTGKHADVHPNQAKDNCIAVHNGIEYKTNPGFLEAARQTWHELNQMPDVKATFYGEGLVQAMAKDYIPEYKGNNTIAFSKPELISDEYKKLNIQLHSDNLGYGVGGGRHAEYIKNLAAKLKTNSILDYGCGKGYLAKNIPFPIWEYDPAIAGKDAPPRPADIVVCTDVLEHIEPERLDFVLDDLQRCTRMIGYFVISTRLATKTLADGRNTHLIVKDEQWWCENLNKFFQVAKSIYKNNELHVIVSPVQDRKKNKIQLMQANKC